MWAIQPEGISDAEDEVGHRPRREQLFATLGMSEPRQVDRHQVGVFGQPWPRWLEGEQALRPWTQQQCVVVALLALGEANRQPVDRGELSLDWRTPLRCHP